jgi:hypothetical protein
MRASRLVLVGVLLVSTAVPTAAPARPRLPGILGAVVGGVLGGVLYHHRHGASARYHGYPSRNVATTTPTEPRPDAGQSAAATAGQAVSTGPLYWPHLADDIVDYVFWPTGTDDRFWAFGYGDIVGGALRPDIRPDQVAARRQRGPAITTASGADVAPGSCPGQQASSVDAVITRLEDAIQPTEGQKPLVANLREALRHGLDYIDTACPTDRPQSPTARLDAMEDRLWAARQTLLITRDPLAKLYDSLNDEQKAKLAGPGSGAGAPASARETTCTQATPELPLAQMGRGGRPSPEQRAGLDALKTTSAGLAKMLAASCPSALPATPVERLDTADKRLNSLLYAVVTLRAPLDAVASVSADAAKDRSNATR